MGSPHRTRGLWRGREHSFHRRQDSTQPGRQRGTGFLGGDTETRALARAQEACREFLGRWAKAFWEEGLQDGLSCGRRACGDGPGGQWVSCACTAGHLLPRACVPVANPG